MQDSNLNQVYKESVFALPNVTAPILCILFIYFLLNNNNIRHGYFIYLFCI